MGTKPSWQSEVLFKGQDDWMCWATGDLVFWRSTIEGVVLTDFGVAQNGSAVQKAKRLRDAMLRQGWSKPVRARSRAESGMRPATAAEVRAFEKKHAPRGVRP